jgi:hypothetical protein
MMRYGRDYDRGNVAGTRGSGYDRTYRSGGRRLGRYGSDYDADWGGWGMTGLYNHMMHSDPYQGRDRFSMQGPPPWLGRRGYAQDFERGYARDSDRGYARDFDTGRHIGFMPEQGRAGRRGGRQAIGYDDWRGGY